MNSGTLRLVTEAARAIKVASSWGMCRRNNAPLIVGAQAIVRVRG
jgi:hypothetical protein